MPASPFARGIGTLASSLLLQQQAPSRQLLCSCERPFHSSSENVCAGEGFGRRRGHGRRGRARRRQEPHHPVVVERELHRLVGHERRQRRRHRRPLHTVDELPSEADYKACSFAGTLSSDKGGATAFTFDKPGTRYFACATGSHCSGGQKVAITVSSGGQTPATPKGNSKGNSAAPMAGAAKVALGLGVGAALLAAF